MASETKTVKKTDDCPGKCKKEECEFQLEVEVEYGLLGGVQVIEKGTVSFLYKPGPPDPPPKKVCTRWCQADLDRSLGVGDHITIVLLDGTHVKLTKDSFAPNTWWPPLWDGLPAAGRDIVEPKGPPEGWTGGSFTTTKAIRDLIVDFTLRTKCMCRHVVKVKYDKKGKCIPVIVDEAIKEGRIRIDGRWPNG